MSSRLIVISAPSGAGKTTLCNRLLSDFPDQLVLSISSTTRPPRGSEQHGREYFFLSREEFEREIQQKRFAEWAIVHGNYYGTSKAVVEKAFAEEKSVLLDIDVQGAGSLKKSYPKEAALFFISPPNIETLEARLRTRNTDSEATIQKRMANAKAEMAQIHNFDHVIVNDSLDRAYLELKKLVAAKFQEEVHGC